MIENFFMFVRGSCKGQILVYHLYIVTYSLTSPYRHLSIMDSSFGLRNAKNHTFPSYLCKTDTSVKRTIDWFRSFDVRIKEV